jgi:large subunit ribosomal protein L30
MKIAVIRIRGSVKASTEIKRTLELMKLRRKNSCIVIDNTKPNLGMLMKVKDFITWGEININTLAKLLLKRARIQGDKKIDNEYIKSKTGKEIEEFCKLVIDGKESLDKLEIKKVFRLKPPSKGFERKGIKLGFKEGGALGYRGEKINELLERMI